MLGAFANAAITTSHLWEQNQQQYNQVWLEMIANDQELPDQTQVTTLLSIAYQCPYAGGEAVYQSRALLGEGHAFDDSTLCNSAALPLVKQPAETVLDFHVFPNPANAFFTVELAEEAATAGTAVLTDLLGRTVAAQDFRESTREFFLIVGQVPAGRYLLTVEVDGERTTKPISIIK